MSTVWVSEVVGIGSIIIFHLSKLWKAKVFILCDVIFISGEAAGEIWNWSLLGAEGLNGVTLVAFIR